MDARRRFVVGVVAAALTAVCMIGYAVSIASNANKQREEALSRYGGEQVEVCVATRELAVGEVVSHDDIELRSWLVDLMPEGVATSADEVAGLQVLYPVAANEPLVSARLGSGDGAIAVPEGMVAVSIPMEDEKAVGGSVRPGQRVNVYQSNSKGTSLLVERAPILETNASEGAQTGTTLSDRVSRPPLSWVTVAVAPEQVEQMVAAARQGGLFLTLPGVDAPREAPVEQETEESLWVPEEVEEGE